MSAAVSTTVAELAALVDGELVRGDGALPILRVMPTDRADQGAVTFVTRPEYLAMLAGTNASAVIIAPDVLERDDVSIPEQVAVIAAKKPYVAFAKAAQLLAKKVPAPVGVHPAAVIEDGAELGADVAIGAFCVIGRGAKIGDGAVLYPGVHVEAESTVGAGSVLYNHAVVRHGCQVGARCILHPGVVVGSDGFGFALSVDESGVPAHHKIPQVGDVVLEDDVEIGSNSCIDRGALGSTTIGTGTKIDNLVQIGHNVTIGRGAILVAQSGVAGSSTLEDGVILGAQAGISGHLTIGAGAVVHGQAGVMKDLEPKAQVAGTPAEPKGVFFRKVVRLTKLDSLFSRVKKLEALASREGPSS
ncbi:MAG: UDP-3-O-(3-hydroxymyristoyl)glucosamine N-acyltransferase [Deltaproteobacteria bacterium]